MHRHWRLALLQIALACTLGCAVAYHTGGPRGPRPAPGGVHVDISIFYQDLAPHGHWFRHGAHGWVWTPYDVPYGWRPYSHGRWIYTQHGWTWLSYWRWGWAPFHYGRWVFDPDYGWVWIPGSVWAPAWVVWRWGDGRVGWAPLPPEVEWRAGIGLTFGAGPSEWPVPEAAWCFVRHRWFLDSRLRDRLEPVPRNVTLTGSSRMVSDYDEFEQRPRNRGPDVREIERALGTDVPRFKLTDADSPRQADRSTQGGVLRAYRPAIAPLAPVPATAPKPETAVAPIPASQTRRAREERRLDEYLQRQERRIQSDHRAEQRTRAPGLDPEALERRQELERRALAEQKERERKIVERRLAEGIVKPQGKAKPAGKAPPKSRR